MNKYSQLTTFIRSTFHEPSEFIPLHDPRFIGNERKYLMECIDSNFVSSVGKFVSQMEQMCAEYTGAKYAVATMNGTAALHIALQLAGVQREDEVLTQALTFIATANAISYTGAHPVFLDVDKETLGLSPAAVEKWLKENVEMRESRKSGDRSRESEVSSQRAYNKVSGRKIAACVPMHTFGHPVKLDELKAVLDKYNIAMVEDAAESLGSYYNEKHTGTTGLFGTLSFNGNKTITTGGGGMILTNNEELAKLAKHITTTAKIPHPWEFRHDMIGYNYRMTNIQAALGCAQMESLDKILKLKRELAQQYQIFFKNSDLQFVSEPENCRSNYWLNAIIAKNRTQRNELLEYTNAHGVMTRPIWELMNRLPMFANCQTDSLENSIWLADRVVNIPSAAPIKGYFKK
jgi:aminotransferase in exopolysaccharide biosynthesis